MMTKEKNGDDIILVDESDLLIGTEKKENVHQKGLLHRAFSVFIINNNRELLLQRRALTKYHSPGLWTNTCCSHPAPDEKTLDAAHRRLKEEMDFDCPLKEIFSFVYKASFENGLIEHEFDHVFVGYWEGKPLPDPREVADFKWADLGFLRKDILKNPQKYTEWFKICFENFLKHRKEN